MTPDNERDGRGVDGASDETAGGSEDPEAEPSGDFEASTGRDFGGAPAHVATASDRIAVQLRAGSPATVHVRLGDVVYEGDPQRLRRIGGRTPRIDAWEVVAVTPAEVTGRDVDSGELRTWDRVAFERGLTTGEYAVELVEFLSVGVRRVDPADGRQARVVATAYGNDGLRYVRRYRVVVDERGGVDGGSEGEDGDDGERRTDRERRDGEDGARLEPWSDAPAVANLPDDLRADFDRRVRDALRMEGYVVER